MFYQHRNGIIEQVKFFRTQPEYMKHAPFDFEVSNTMRRKSREDTAVVVTCAIFALALYALVYSK